jgi:hypothetical protein
MIEGFVTTRSLVFVRRQNSAVFEGLGFYLAARKNTPALLLGLMTITTPLAPHSALDQFRRLIHVPAKPVARSGEFKRALWFSVPELRTL